MTWAQAVLAHPDLTDAQRDTLASLVNAYGSPFAFSMVAAAALPTWQNIGTVSVRLDGRAFHVSTGAPFPPAPKCRKPRSKARGLAAHRSRTYLVEWRDRRGGVRETYIPASDAATAGATIAANPECARVVDAIALRMPTDGEA
jgi:hypothetical protein